MRYYSIKRGLRGACATVLLFAAASFADSTPSSNNPQTNASDRNYDTNQPNSVPGGMQKAEDAGNRGLNKVDNGVHKVIGKSKKGAHHAKKKVDAGVDQMSEPAKKPAY